MEIEKIIIKKYEIVIIYNENREELEKKEHLKGEDNSTKIKNRGKLKLITIIFMIQKKKFLIQNEALQNIEETYKKLSTSGKVFMIAGVIIGGITLIAGVIEESILEGI